MMLMFYSNGWRCYYSDAVPISRAVLTLLLLLLPLRRCSTSSSVHA
jgi:hypothetical protein